jgi:hypothetical protein
MGYLLDVENAVRDVVHELLIAGDRKATKYLSPKLTVKASRQFRPDARQKNETFVLTIGKPNFAERAFIKTAIKAGEPFPIRRVLLKQWPAKKLRAKRRKSS